MSTTITFKDLKNTRKRIFFIIGTSRSGSTLFQSMLSSHSEMIVPPETHFFHSYQHLQRVYDQVEDRSSFRDQLIQYWYEQKTRIRDLNLKVGDVQVEAGKLNITNPVDLFTLQLTMYRMQRGKKIIGEKTPRHMLHIPEIMSAFPDAKIISLFRDPRAKAYSEMNAEFGSPSVMVSTTRWRKYVQIHKKLRKYLNEDRYLMLQYADLIENTERVLQKICGFLGVSFEEQMLDYYKRDETGFAQGEASWKKQTLKPLQKNKNEEWKTGLSNWQVDLVENRAGTYLEGMGYQKWSSDHTSILKRLYWQLIDYCRSIRATLAGSRQEGYNDPNKFTYKLKQ